MHGSGSDFHIMPAYGRDGNAVDEAGGRGVSYPAMIFFFCVAPPWMLPGCRDDIKVAPIRGAVACTNPHVLRVGKRIIQYKNTNLRRLIRRGSNGLMD